jgi:hypothetical protein
MVQLWFLLEVIECGCDASWLSWWKKRAMVHDLEHCGSSERRGRRFMNRDHIDCPRRLWNRTVTWGLFIPGSELDPFTIPAFPFLFPFPLSPTLMEHGNSTKGSQASEEVDSPLAA